MTITSNASEDDVFILANAGRRSGIKNSPTGVNEKGQSHKTLPFSCDQMRFDASTISGCSTNFHYVDKETRNKIEAKQSIMTQDESSTYAKCFYNHPRHRLCKVEAFAREWNFDIEIMSSSLSSRGKLLNFNSEAALDVSALVGGSLKHLVICIT